MGTMVLVLVLASVGITLVSGDCYMQYPPGSNNRNGEARRERRNANRLFNSQNNNRGGYNAAPIMEYYAGSTLRIEWTNQHSCGNINNNCEVIVQYFCDEKIRDGSTTKTIPLNQANCQDNDCLTDMEFGMHEDYESYKTCRFTYGNKNLFKADQKLRGHTAKYTRQSRQGQRHGYECPEEREYYPYWRPTVWKDIVVMTNNKTRCAYYQKHSHNVEHRYECKPPAGYMDYLVKMGDRNRRAKYIPITKEECEALKHEGQSGEWVKVDSHGIDAPACIESWRNRDNHNGNKDGGETNFYEWKIPEDVNTQCVLRMRYNISTNDFHAWDITARDNEAPVHKLVNLDEATAAEMGYVFKTNPVLSPIWELQDGQNVGKDFKLRLAINTAQFGRTFQDRSHTFSILKRPDGIKINDKIYNVGVRGKRGNIVQTYPGTEYDFSPETLEVECDKDYIHFQWTGSNNNPRNNAGQGVRGSDRNNICMLGNNKYPKSGAVKSGDGVGESDEGIPTIKYGHLGASYPAKLKVDGRPNFLGLPDDDVQRLCSSGVRYGSNDELDEAGVYYNHRIYKPENGGLVQCACQKEGNVAVTSIWYYMCTRNNNFTNRSQKAKIICKPPKSDSTTTPSVDS